MLKVIQEQTPWYANGLHFSCTGCGECCTGAPGYVWVDEQEIREIAEFLQLSIEDFSRRFLRRVNDRFSLLEHRKTYDCIFLKEKKCQIYSVRPIQCRTFPWWPSNLQSEKTWEEAARTCEGICSQAPLVPRETIEEQSALQEKITKNAH